MAHELDRLSLSMGLDGDYFDFDARFLLGPAAFGRPELRFFTHECIHLWQLLGSGFLTELAYNQWSELREFEASRTLPTARGHKFTEADPDAEFSAHELSEALCRFWDVHIVGPADLLDEPYAGASIYRRAANLPHGDSWLTEGLSPEVIDRLRSMQAYSAEQYDRWMLQEDAYAEPYRLMLKRVGSARAAALFPIVGYFALQTPQPCRAFVGAVSKLRGFTIPRAKYISDTWREIFRTVADVCASAAVAQTGTVLTPGANFIKELAGEGNVVYRHYRGLLALANEYWATDVRLALPGDPEFRAQLATFFLPAVVHFHQGRWTPDAVSAKIGRIAKVPGLLPQPELADEATALHRRYKKMRRAELSERYRR